MIDQKRAFTLIELIGVIIILGILALIIYPIMTGTIKRQEKKSFHQSLEGIISAVRNDMATDDNIVPRYYYYENGRLTLLSANNNEKNEEIKTNGKAKVKGYVYVDIEGNIILDYLCDKKYCGYNTEDSSEVVVIPKNDNEKPSIDLETPILTLKGKEMMVLNIGGRYIEPGVEAKTKLGKDLSEYVVTTIEKEGQTVSTIDTSSETEYVITYSVTYQDQTVEKQRTVVVKEERPEITITSASSKYVKKQDIQIKVSPTGSNQVTNFVYTINGEREKTVMGTSTNLSLTESGQYRIKVEATDDHGHKASIISEVYKIDNIAPKIIVPETTKIKNTEIGGYNPLDGVEITDNVGVVETKVEGSLSANVGMQTITLIAHDEAGNETKQMRNIEVISAQGPILNLSSVRTDSWVKTVTVTATATATTNITTFTYEVIKDGVSKGVQNGTISGTSGTVNIPFTESGKYQIKLTGIDEFGSSSNLTSGEYLIDNSVPTAPVVTGGSTSYTKTSRTINVETESTSLSGIHHYEYYISTSSTSQTGGSWTALTSGTQQITVSTEGTRYVYMRAINNVGTTGTISSPATVKIDKTSPTIANVKAKGYVGGNTVMATLTDNTGLAGYAITSASANSCSGTAPTSWTSITGTSHNLSAKTTGYGTNYLWIKDSAGNTKCTSKALYTIKYVSTPSKTCSINEAKLVDGSGVLTFTITSTCSCTANGTCKTGDYGTDSDRAYLSMYVYGNTQATYTIKTLTRGSFRDLLYYDTAGKWVFALNTNTDYTTNLNGKLTYNMGYGRDKEVTTNTATISKIVSGTTTVYNGGFVEY